MMFGIAKEIHIVAMASLCASTTWADQYPRERLSRILDMPPKIESISGSTKIKSRFVSYKDNDAASSTFGTELCVVEIPKGAGNIKVKIIKAEGNPAYIYKSRVDDKALAIVTGGFFGLDKKGSPMPIGLVRTNGNQVSNMLPWETGGIIAARTSSVAIFPVSEAQKSKAYPEAIQSKPMLIWQGKDGILTSTGDRFDRSAIANDDAGTIFFFVIHEPAGGAASLAEFSHLLLKYRSATGGKISSALAMDGGPGAHLYVPSLDRNCGSGIPNYIPNAVYAK